MKAVVVEIKDNFAAALSDDGCITKIRNNNYAIGQVIEMKKAVIVKKKMKSRIAIAVCAALIFGALGTSVYAYTTPVTYVSLDVNPSIEYSLNMFDRVLSATAVNDDGEEVLNQVDLENLNNKPIDEAIKLTVDEISNEGYFDGDTEGGIVITTSGNNEDKSADLAQQLEQTANEQCVENEKEVVVEATAVGKKRVEEAKALGVTPGKLNLVQKLKASSANPDEIDINEWLKKPVKEIMKETKQNRIKNRNENSSNTEESQPEKEQEQQQENSAQAVSELSSKEDVSSEVESRINGKSDEKKDVSSQAESKINGKSDEKKDKSNTVESKINGKSNEKKNNMNNATSSVNQKLEEKQNNRKDIAQQKANANKKQISKNTGR